jgi:hypothetical protein
VFGAYSAEKSRLAGSGITNRLNNRNKKKQIEATALNKIRKFDLLSFLLISDRSVLLISRALFSTLHPYLPLFIPSVLQI